MDRLKNLIELADLMTSDTKSKGTSSVLNVFHNLKGIWHISLNIISVSIFSSNKSMKFAFMADDSMFLPEPVAGVVAVVRSFGGEPVVGREHGSDLIDSGVSETDRSRLRSRLGHRHGLRSFSLDEHGTAESFRYGARAQTQE